MLFKFNGETYRATPGAGLLSALGQANAHFGSKLPHPGAWMDGKPEPSGINGGTTATFNWTEGNFFD
jgi:hypothetical protein